MSILLLSFIHHSPKVFSQQHVGLRLILQFCDQYESPMVCQDQSCDLHVYRVTRLESCPCNVTFQKHYFSRDKSMMLGEIQTLIDFRHLGAVKATCASSLGSNRYCLVTARSLALFVPCFRSFYNILPHRSRPTADPCDDSNSLQNDRAAMSSQTPLMRVHHVTVD